MHACPLISEEKKDPTRATNSSEQFVARKRGSDSFLRAAEGRKGDTVTRYALPAAYRVCVNTRICIQARQTH